MKPVPRIDRFPLPLSSQARRAALRQRHPADLTDPFATDPNADVRDMGKLALRFVGEVDYLFALVDLCAVRCLSPDHHLRIFYVGKVLIACQRVLSGAPTDADRTLTKQYLEAFAAWLLEVVETYPTPRNVAVVLWAAAGDEDPHLPKLHLQQAQVARLLALYGGTLLTAAADELSTQTATSSPPPLPTRAELDTQLDSDSHFHREFATQLGTSVQAVDDTREQSLEAPLERYASQEQPLTPPAPLPSPNLPESVRAPAVGSKTNEADFRVGELILERYEVADVRFGGMGVVYLCYDHENREPVAIKSFQKRFMDNERAVARFEQEALVWIRLEKHPHIVQARLVQNIRNRPHIFLEYISGVEGVGADLRQWIDSRRLTLKDALLFALHIALGMHHATTRLPNLVHRDIKPGNVLVTHDGIAKITDFGLVRSVDVDRLPAAGAIGDADDLRLTRQHVFVGTPPYMAPEQFTNRDVDQRADIYSFGCLLFEMLTGKPPFKAKGANEWRRVHSEQPPEFDPATRAALPSEVCEVVLACLAKQPVDRPSRWLEVVERLAAVYAAHVGELPALATSGSALEARELMDKGYSLTELGRYEEALQAYDAAVAKKPDYAWALARKGRTLRLLNRLEDARACYERALQIQPDYAWGWNGKGIILDRMGDTAGALAAFERACEYNPKDVWHWYNRADMLQKLGRDDEAAAVISRALELNPRHANSWAKLGQMQRLRGEYEAAVVSYETALEHQPDYAWAHNGCGLALKALGRLSEAAEAFERAARHEPNVVWHWYNHAETLVMLGKFNDALYPAQEATRVDPQHSPSWGKLGQILRYLGQYAQALEAYQRAVALDPQFDWAMNGMGLVLEQLDRLEDALACYEQATRINPSREWHWYNRGNALYLLNRFTEALHSFSKALEINPNHARSCALTASALRHLGRLEEAQVAGERAVALDPRYAWAWHEVGLIAEALGQIEKALQAYQAAAQLEPSYPLYVYKQADMLHLLNRFDEALKLLERALRLNPRSPHAWAKKGQVLRRVERYSEALDAYQRALDLDAEYIWAWHGLGVTFSALGRREEAIQAFKQALAIDSSDVWLWYHYADELLTCEYTQEAVDALQEALRVDAHHSESWSKLAQALRMQGRFEDALGAYERALTLKPDFAWAWNGKGLTLRELGQLEEAKQAFTRAIVQDERVISYRINLIVTLLDMEQAEDALKVAENTLLLAADNPNVYARHAQALRRLHRYEEAVLSYDKALALDPYYAWAWNGKGLCLLELGRIDEALYAYHQAVTYDAGDLWFWHNYAEALHLANQHVAALNALQKALEIDPNHLPSQHKQAQIQRELEDL